MDIQPLFARVVGMDVHLMVIHVGVILQRQDGEPEVHRQQFGTFKHDLRTRAEWIAGFSPHTVVMESTGIDWKSPYTTWNGSDSGRWWSTPGTLNRSPAASLSRACRRDRHQRRRMAGHVGAGQLHPPEQLRHLRQVSRYHQRTTAMLAMEKNRLVKVLGDAGIRLRGMVSDLHGVAARAMIDGPSGGRRHAGGPPPHRTPASAQRRVARYAAG